MNLYKFTHISLLKNNVQLKQKKKVKKAKRERERERESHSPKFI